MKRRKFLQVLGLAAPAAVAAKSAIAGGYKDVKKPEGVNLSEQYEFDDNSDGHLKGFLASAYPGEISFRDIKGKFGV